MHRFITVVLLIALGATSARCTSMKTIRPASPPDAPFTGVKAGDIVQIQTKDGQRLRFVVQQVDGDAIVAPNAVRFGREDIVRLERRSFSLPKTLVAAGGAFAATCLLIAIAAVSALGDWE